MAKDQGTGKKKVEGRSTSKKRESAATALFVLKGHTKQVTALTFAPDGQTLVSGSADNTVRLWDATSGKPCPCGVMNEAPWGIAEVAFSPDGRTVAAVSRGVNRPVQGHTRVFLWNLVKRQVVELEPNGGGASQFRSPTFAPGGGVIAFLYQGVCLYSTATGERMGQFSPGDKGDRIAFSPDGRCLVFGNWEGPLGVFGVDDQKAVRTLEDHTDYITALAFSQDGRWLASASSSHGQPWEPREEDRAVCLWDFREGKQTHRWSEGWETTPNLVFLADNRHLLSFHDSHGHARLTLWASDATEALASWSPQGGVMAVAAWSTTSTGQGTQALIATGHADGSVKVWNMAAVLPAPGIIPFHREEPGSHPAPLKRKTSSPPPRKGERSGRPAQEEYDEYFPS